MVSGHLPWQLPWRRNWLAAGLLAPSSTITPDSRYNPTYQNGIACNAFYPEQRQLQPAPRLVCRRRRLQPKSTDTFKNRFWNIGVQFLRIRWWNSLFHRSQLSSTTRLPGTLCRLQRRPRSPEPPAIDRNTFIGPRYSDIDLAATKSFGLPTMKFLGEGARIEIRANAFNVFNKTEPGQYRRPIFRIRTLAAPRTHSVPEPSKASSTSSSNASINPPALGLYARAQRVTPIAIGDGQQDQRIADGFPFMMETLSQE